MTRARFHLLALLVVTMAGPSRGDVPARAAAGGTLPPDALSSPGPVALNAARTSQPAVPAIEEQKTLQAQINAAQNGDVILVPAGTYHGSLVIDRPIILRGIGQPRLIGARDGHVIEIKAPHVTVEGFHISGSGLNLSLDHAAIHISGDHAVIRGNRISRSLHGIYVRAAEQTRIEHNVIRGIDPEEVIGAADDLSAFGAGEVCASSLRQDRRGNGIHCWNSSGHFIAHNDIAGTRDGIYFSFVNGSRIEGNRIYGARYGLHYMYSHRNLFSNNRFFDNAAGAALMYSREIVIRDNEFTRNRGYRAYGILLHTVENSVLERNKVQANTTGIYLQSCFGNVARRNEFTRNYIGFRLTSSSMDNVFAGNVIGGNLHNVDLAGRSPGNRWEENGAGNHWEGATALDLTRNGVSELPHHEVDLFGPTRKDFPYIAFLSGSPGMKALQFALQRAPIPNVPFVTDPKPLVRPK